MTDSCAKPRILWTWRYYDSLSAELCSEEAHLQERDGQRTEEFWDRFCSTPFGYLIAFHEDRVIGRVRLFRRAIVHAGAQVMLGGIGFVATRLAYRHQGVASGLLREGMGKLTTQGCEVAFLIANTANQDLVRLYSKQGFVLLPKVHQFRSRSGKLYTDTEHGMLAPLSSRDKFDLVLSSRETLDLGIGVW